MAWTETTRSQYRCPAAGFAGDLTDAQREVSAPLLPRPCTMGRPWTANLRAVLNAIFHVLWTGCPWRALPGSFPPRSTVQGCLYRWRDDGTWPWINRVLVTRLGQAEGRRPFASAGITDSQSVRTTESGGPRGFDAVKKVKGRKRHIVTDARGFLMKALVHTAMCRTAMARCRC